MLKDLDKVTEIEIEVDQQYHRHFVMRRGEILRQISEELGVSQISFPKPGIISQKVIIKGKVLWQFKSFSF